MRTIILKSFVLIIFFFNSGLSQEVIDGRWEGSISIMETNLEIIVNLESINDSLTGTIDIPQQNASNLPLSNIRYDFPKLSFVLEIPTGNAEFEGEIIQDSIKGSFQQSGVKGTFYLSRSKGDNQEVLEDEVLPYIEEEVTFYNGDIKLSGTLTLPEYPGKHPAVVMITGSGPQDRNEEIFGFKIFKIIADHFTKNGIAVLRYDDRGVGESTGNISESTTEDFAGDVTEAVKYLQTRNDIRHDNIGLCGHSEGGIIAPLVASRYKDIAFIILVAGTGVTGEEIILEQTRLILKTNGMTDEEIKENSEQSKNLFSLLKSGIDKDEIISELRKLILKDYESMTEEEKELITNKDEYVNNTANSKYDQLTSPWMTYFLFYDPVPALEKVTCPVLMLFGGLDLQVPVSQNEKPMVDALLMGNNKDFEVKTFPKANHLFQTANTGSPSEYANLPKEFTPGFLDYMTSWILERFSVSR
ncbi:MAG: alpha/beta hydrolase [Bacteroidetes bacterium]|nr:alpha/beta hydrolase [Bacteroidota bacterium]